MICILTTLLDLPIVQLLYPEGGRKCEVFAYRIKDLVRGSQKDPIIFPSLKMSFAFSYILRQWIINWTSYLDWFHYGQAKRRNVPNKFKKSIVFNCFHLVSESSKQSWMISKYSDFVDISSVECNWTQQILSDPKLFPVIALLKVFWNHSQGFQIMSNGSNWLKHVHTCSSASTRIHARSHTRAHASTRPHTRVCVSMRPRSRIESVW